MTLTPTSTSTRRRRRVDVNDDDAIDAEVTSTTTSTDLITIWKLYYSNFRVVIMQSTYHISATIVTDTQDFRRRSRISPAAEIFAGGRDFRRWQRFAPAAEIFAGAERESWSISIRLRTFFAKFGGSGGRRPPGFRGSGGRSPSGCRGSGRAQAPQGPLGPWGG